MLRAAGIVVALVVLTACQQNTPNAVASPSPVIAAGTWTQNLTFSGDLSGTMTSIVADSGDQKNECSGVKARSGQVWGDTFYGTIDASGDIWEVNFSILDFRGHGAYSAPSVTVVVKGVADPADKTKNWSSQGGPNKVTFSMDTNQQSGLVTADLTNVQTGKTALHVAGEWHCRG
jgi:hypothetical protein